MSEEKPDVQSSEAPTTGEARWWVASRIVRLMWVPMMWLFVPMGICLFIAGVFALFSHDADKWSNVALGLLWPGWVFIMSRVLLIAVGLEGDDLLLRHPFPGTVERVPLSRVRRISIADELFGFSVTFVVSRSLPARLEGRNRIRHPDPSLEEILAALKVRLAPEGRWRD